MPLPIRPNVRKMAAYSPGKPIAEVQRKFGLEEVVKLASNENPLGPSPLAMQAIREAAQSVHLYPDADASDLTAKLAERFGFPAERIVVGNGSDELIALLGHVLLSEESDEVLCGDPTFLCYDLAALLAGCRLVKVPLDDKGVHDLPAMASRLTERTRIVFLPNPCNPTGTIVDKSDLNAFLRDLPETALLVLDEAYFEFAQDVREVPDGREIALERDNVAALRTFSKAYGLAGVRCGYGFFSAELADALLRAKQPFNVNVLAQVAGLAALDDEDHLQRTLANNREGLERIAAALRRLGSEPFVSHANFVYADLKRPAGLLVQTLMEQGVIVRSGAPFGQPNAIRVTVGTPKELDRFEEALSQCAAEAAR
jgi:histidinol-phosphate aminotransferase